MCAVIEVCFHKIPTAFNVGGVPLSVVDWLWTLNEQSSWLYSHTADYDIHKSYAVL